MSSLAVQSAQRRAVDGELCSRRSPSQSSRDKRPNPYSVPLTRSRRAFRPRMTSRVQTEIAALFLQRTTYTICLNPIPLASLLSPGTWDSPPPPPRFLASRVNSAGKSNDIITAHTRGRCFLLYASHNECATCGGSR
ncbi:hypothetical protein PUNSTDRAFT_122940 [Punctularia strigosozonata HHB-11173 SS5]|uniref:Uncharacterized protein n=1 Tax=Punctularia strigosozonata (strain HHB-11173) TaxID=741275 RepID=R7S4B6_PUNST|nr:uncharacterized protein PUNSTDRAFT_122940 [Punctularia strigosozonata HHB-11173 SS5]EIN04086.1 hypothetical protein PUNSTDRAFT_122940 [Punctularia strigosozonata HHB-11173 SS5]